MRTLGRWECFVVLLMVYASACAPIGDDEQVELGAATQHIIYGADDRRDVFDHPDLQLRALAQSSVVALIPRAQFSRDTDGDIRILTRRLSDAFDVCSDERFHDQPTAAVCSGVLLEDDLVLTAGHCFPTDGCERYAFVFDYYYRSPAKLEPIGWGDIYGCRRIVDHVVSPEGSESRVDYALVQLDRPAAGRKPVTLRSTPLLPGEPLATIGCASGLPAKIDTGSRVINTRAPQRDFFLLDSDTFEGSSGSGVFDVSAQLVGVLVRGGKDYQPRMGADCMVPNVVQYASDAAVPGLGEEATFVGRAIEGLCAKGWPSMRLCGRPPVCGDGFCTVDESRAQCPNDCGCTRGDCETRATAPAAAGAVALKSREPEADEGCSLGAGARAGSSSLLLALAALLTGRARSRRLR